MNSLERGIAAIAPQWALRRSVARAQLGVTATLEKRQAERGARFGESWGRNDPRDRIAAQNATRRPLTAVDRAKLRRIFRLNPFAKKMKATLLNNLVGYGITATPKGSKKLQNEWQAWIALADHDGVQDLYGLQELAVWTMLLDGEAFAVRRLVSEPGRHPLRIQLFTVDQLDCTRIASNIRDGIEYGSDGRPVAYHFRTALDDLFTAGGASGSDRVLAIDVIHLFRREQPGQWRGWSHFESIVDPLEDIDDYIESEGVRKKLESCFVAFVERAIDADGDSRPLGDVGAGGGIEAGSADGAPRTEGFYPGMVSYLDQGETVKFGEPKAAGGLAEYLRWGALRGAAGAEVTYEGLTGDLSNVNFSSYRAGANEFQAGCGRLQWLTIIPLFCEGIAAWWLEAGFSTGRIGPRDRAAIFKHTPPRVPTIDRKGDATAAKIEMEIGIESRRNLVAERGNDHDRLMDEIGEDRKANTKRGIAFQGDPSTPGASNAGNNGNGGTEPADASADDGAGSGDAASVV